jgi:RHS repeat-associated protein
MDDRQRVARIRAGVPHPDDHTPAFELYLADHLGSNTLTTDSHGAPVSHEEYTPYGETSFGSVARKRYRFTGAERDEESGLAYHGHRYYAPGLARWISSDPAGAGGGLNGYTYAAANPMCLVDTSGLQPEDTLPQDGNGNYILPGQIIEIHDSKPRPDELQLQIEAGNAEFQDFDQYKNRLADAVRTAPDLTWTTGPPNEWEEAERTPEEKQARWDKWANTQFFKERAVKAAEVEHALYRTDNAANVGNAVVVGLAAAAVASVAAPLIVAAGESTVVYSLGATASNSAPAVAGLSFAYGIAAPPGSPDIPFLPSDDAGRGARSILSQMSNWFSRGGGKSVPKDVEEAGKLVRSFLNGVQARSRLWTDLLPRDIYGKPMDSNVIHGLIDSGKQFFNQRGEVDIDDEALAAWDLLLKYTGR